MLLAMVSTSACSRQSAQPVPKSSTAPQASATLAAVPPPPETVILSHAVGRYSLRSNVPKIRIVPTTELPAISGDPTQPSDASCDSWGLIKAKSPEGRWAQSRGWRVADEQMLGPVRAVVMLRRYEYETEVCWAVDGRIVLFDGGKMIATITTKPGEPLQVGAMWRTERGTLRIVTGSRDQPFGDLVISDGHIAVEPLPPWDTSCHGRERIPNIIGMQIEDARKALGHAGWKPLRSPRVDPEVIDAAGSRYDQGLTEVVTCAPQSSGVCLFQYRSPGATMLVSQGDNSGTGAVFSYDVDCKRQIARRSRG